VANQTVANQTVANQTVANQTVANQTVADEATAGRAPMGLPGRHAMGALQPAETPANSPVTTGKPAGASIVTSEPVPQQASALGSPGVAPLPVSVPAAKAGYHPLSISQLLYIEQANSTRQEPAGEPESGDELSHRKTA
jgi:hypothetical protein